MSANRSRFGGIETAQYINRSRCGHEKDHTGIVSATGRRRSVAIPLGGRKLERDCGLAHGQSRRLSLAEETFAGLCKSVSDDLPLNL